MSSRLARLAPVRTEGMRPSPALKPCAWPRKEPGALARQPLPESVRGLRAAADAGELGEAVRLDVELPEGLDECRGDRVVAAACAERADLAFVVPAREAELVLRQRRVVELGLGDVGHALLLTSGRGPGWSGRSSLSPWLPSWRFSSSPSWSRAPSCRSCPASAGRAKARAPRRSWRRGEG